jgi:hypothetical protein
MVWTFWYLILSSAPPFCDNLTLGKEPVTLLVNRQATFDEIAQALVAKHASIPAEVHDRIRLFEVRQHRDYREFQTTQNLSMAGLETSYGSHLYAEPIPLEEEEAGELDKAIVVVHFQKEFTRLHGVPIRFVVKPVCPLACSLFNVSWFRWANHVQRELWYDTKKRLQKRLGSKEKDFAKIKAFFVTDPSHYPKLAAIEDGTPLPSPLSFLCRFNAPCGID